MAVTIAGMERLQQKLTSLAGGRVARDSVEQAAQYIKYQAVIYPGIRRQKQPFKTDKQRRFFFAALRDGTITVPYMRKGISGGLASRWVIVKMDGGLGAGVVNDTPYGKFVMGNPPYQAKYHQGNWKTEKDIADAAERPVLEIVTRNIVAELNRK
jgi:hypothetical protein